MIRLGARESASALEKAGAVTDALEKSGHAVGLEALSDSIEVALLEGRIDVAVTSFLKLPVDLPEGLVVAAVPERDDPRDVLVGPSGEAVTLRTLERGATVGTDPGRRSALLRAFRRDVKVESVSGSIEERLARIETGELDALVLGGSALRRAGREDRVSEWLERTAWVPAPGQGATAFVVRAEDRQGRAAASGFADPPTLRAVRAERRLAANLGALDGGHVGALAVPFGDRLRLWGLVIDEQGGRAVRHDVTGTLDAPEELADLLAAALRRRGAERVLRRDLP